ncbi:NADH:ubiquinone reductase (Na(+)-transporting) subunit F [Marinobacterium arenosum]|uniref:NADH:ubiquinone reductase (Na(+)-transporting) subunit F n=1 Tax=Marinobacterium arenosum TaxID=2862496 RepID=UPI001C93ECE7|nr:phenol 2-monooxygenase domain-containing protein [Marinobacterium arenosum]MBY4676716.1 2Fe-2S iron-sulfur cluster binding domain-containing protein [Marinobacterium arenosum]
MTYEVTIEPTGDVIQVDDDQTILDAALRQGVWLPFACGHGTCGTCKCTVTDGDVDLGDASPFALMDSEREEGVVLACCAKPESDLTLEADIDVDPDFAGYPVRDFVGTVTEIRDLSPTIKGIWFELDGAIEFQAGQYVNLHIPGVEGSRAFSIANKPSDSRTVELHVRRVPNGAGTGYLHDQLQVGDTLDISGPYGQFFTRKSDSQDVIFIGGGSGVSSPQSMVLELLEENDPRQIYLFQGARNVSELYNRELYLQLAEQHDNFHYIPALNAPEVGDDWEGFTGFVHEAAIDYFDGKFNGHKAYLCGPPPMIDAAITALMQGRLFERDIHMERFFTAADGADEQARSALFKRI